MIVTDGLTKEFEDFIAVDRLTLRVEAGEVLALLGPNGAGKTTTVRMLISIFRPSRGWARVAGYDVVTQAEKVRGSVGVLTEQHGLYTRMPAWEYLDFFGRLYGLEAPARRRRAHRLMEEFGLAEFGNRRIGKYSKGMRQKLALARTLLHEPPVILLDEPTSALDPESAILVRDAIQALRSAERAIVICTHNLAEAERLADKIAIIRRGRIIAFGTPDELKQKLLGPAEYEVRFDGPCPEKQILLPSGIPISARKQGWLRYRTAHPWRDNPLVLRNLLDQGFPIVGLQEVPRSLEQVYLQAINAPDAEEALHVH
ncbi:MAG TPA: ABC transporter ATP-binding protein [Anaerolineales bacterium]|nr:ABC transporter ATP-binding protein [Anaerolineales bacterium]